jgi:predicted MFS family arabinose efflux permease
VTLRRVRDGVTIALVSERRSLLVWFVAVAVAVAFADSSIVVLALPELYGRFDTTIEGVSWVVTAYNASVALVALALVFVVHRWSAARVLAGGLVIFIVASLVCASSGSLALLIAARCVQGAGAALLLAGALPILVALTGSAVRGGSIWTVAGTFGAALGPALGGVVTQVFDWRAIFAVQAPLAALALVAAAKAPASSLLEEGWRPSLTRTIPANVCLGLLFGALVGALFLSVLLVITAWGYSPIGGAAIISVLPASTLAARRLASRLDALVAVWAGAGLLALGLLALGFLPSASVGRAMAALVLCGVGLGLAVPVLSAAALDAGAGLTRSGTLTIGVRHLGLVLALAVIAPILAAQLPSAGHEVTLRATAVLLDAPIGLRTKVPVALAVAAELQQARAGEIPDLSKPFDDHGARSDSDVAAVRDDVIATIESTITRSFRSAFVFSAALAAGALLLAVVLRKRVLL